MSESSSPTPDASSRMLAADRSPDVNSYVAHLRDRMLEVCARYGVDHPASLAPLILDGTVPEPDRALVRELRVALADAMRDNAVPPRDRDWRRELAGRPFAYDREKAGELGFAELSVEAHPGAQEIVDAVYGRDPRFADEAAIKAFWAANCAGLPDVPGSSMQFFKNIAEHRLSDSIDGDDRATATSPSRPHVPRLGSPGFVLAMDWAEFDYDNAAQKATAITPQTKALMRRLFGAENVTNVSRETVNSALWVDHDARVPSAKALEIIRELVPGQDPSGYELRLMRYDEYARAAESRGYGKKNLWTWFDGYVGHGVGPRSGLIGGYRDDGGAANVGSNLRGGRYEDIAVRLVLSRK